VPGHQFDGPQCATNFDTAIRSDPPKIAVARHKDALMHFGKAQGETVIQAQLAPVLPEVGECPAGVVAAQGTDPESKTDQITTRIRAEIEQLPNMSFGVQF
jgi:hypothetical protein